MRATENLIESHAAPAAAAVASKKAAATVGIRDKRLQIFLAQRSATARNRVLFELERRRRIDQDRGVAERVLGKAIP